jgi:hypothetical protein
MVHRKSPKPGTFPACTHQTSYRFGFGSGSQIALVEQFEEAVGLYPRQQLRLVLKQKLGVELSP